jgi:predicted transcriptional regulator
VTTTAASPTPLWVLTHGADLAIHVWGDDCVVHHALSNDTHRLAAWLAPALKRLAQAPAASLAELADLMGLDSHDAMDTLEQLERLQLIQQC